ncbi:MAG: hypothetical protein LBI43_06135 [Streptococcaceae bacterium]|jgi:hypothetical protein|nr:hypothetical protein [Streptococcaceae bacterium]
MFWIDIQNITIIEEIIINDKHASKGNGFAIAGFQLAFIACLILEILSFSFILAILGSFFSILGLRKRT